ncbi:MAG: DUF2550 domain-containing protein [Haloechinothrix sp.]
MDITVVVIGLLIAVGSVFAWIALRWRGVLKVGGVNVALRWRTEQAGLGWHLGIGRYRGAEFLWYRVMSVRRGPDRVLDRDELQIAERRDPTDIEVYALPAGSSVLRFKLSEGDPIEIAMGPGTLTGFLSWLESAPPGRQIHRAG